MKISDSTAEAWITAFNEPAKEIIGYSADDLYKIMNDEGEDIFQQKLKELLWMPRLFRVAVTQIEYMNEKKQKITVISQSAIDYSAESSFLLEEISKADSKI